MDPCRRCGRQHDPLVPCRDRGLDGRPPIPPAPRMGPRRPGVNEAQDDTVFGRLSPGPPALDLDAGTYQPPGASGFRQRRGAVSYGSSGVPPQGGGSSSQFRQEADADYDPDLEKAIRLSLLDSQKPNSPGLGQGSSSLNCERPGSRGSSSSSDQQDEAALLAAAIALSLGEDPNLQKSPVINPGKLPASGPSSPRQPLSLYSGEGQSCPVIMSDHELRELKNQQPFIRYFRLNYDFTGGSLHYLVRAFSQITMLDIYYSPNITANDFGELLNLRNLQHLYISSRYAPIAQNIIAQLQQKGINVIMLRDY